LKRLNRELGMTMLLVTHDERVASLATRRLRLDDGRVVEAAASTSV